MNLNVDSRLCPARLRGKKSASKALGAALAMEAHEKEPKSRRFGPPFMCRASQMQAVRVSAKKSASSDASSLRVAARNSGRIGLIAGPFST